jgi:hypothetical protein
LCDGAEVFGSLRASHVEVVFEAVDRLLDGGQLSFRRRRIEKKRRSVFGKPLLSTPGTTGIRHEVEMPSRKARSQLFIQQVT